jgi:Uncharacterized protein conserved in bacteria
MQCLRRNISSQQQQQQVQPLMNSFSSDASTAPATSTTTSTNSKRTIRACPKSTNNNLSTNKNDVVTFNNNCVSTSNIKQLDMYSPPWTFEVTPEEAFARLKGIVNSDPSLDLVEIDEKDKYLRVETKRLAVVDYIEFLIKDDDQVVLFQSAEKMNPEGALEKMTTGGSSGASAAGTFGISDFGAIRKRLEDLRKRSGGIFNVMGEGFTADSYDGGAYGKRNGIGGQLKAFYGLNSGQGFESVFE